MRILVVEDEKKVAKALQQAALILNPSLIENEKTSLAQPQTACGVPHTTERRNRPRHRSEV